MEKIVQITSEESKAVEDLFYKFNSYCNVLGQLMSYGSFEDDNVFFTAKWEEALKLNQQLEKLKAQLDYKYHPDEHHSNYTFDFDNAQMIYRE